MDVVAISTPASSGWRWRIIDYSGEMVEESNTTFASIASATADGMERIRARDDAESASATRRHDPARWRGRPR
jgi:hypothetical protein